MILNQFTRLKGIGRFACLGSAVLDVLGRRYKIHNIQKGRVDYLLEAHENSSLLCKATVAKTYLARSYLAHTLDQQEKICPSFKPELVFIDSFSDLTDQVFEHTEQHWKFCCNYQDIQHSDYFSANFIGRGLLDLETLNQNYLSAIKLIEARWPSIPIIYLHFPNVLERREKFIERAQQIKSVVDMLAINHDNLFSFSVPSSIVKHPEIIETGLEDFPYHYNKNTYDTFAEMIRGNKKLRKLF
jgi:hypothetical protein